MKHDFDKVVDRRKSDSVKYSPLFFPEDVLPMWVADSDFKAPKEVVSALVSRAEHGIYGYTPESTQLKEAVSRWMSARHGLSLDTKEIFYCPGVIPGIVYGIRAFSSPGDGVIIQTPCYRPFVQAVERNARTVERNPLLLQNGRYKIDFSNFEILCKKKENKIFILCNPQNPTGRVFSREELCTMAEICSRNQVIVLSDEIHGDIVYPGKNHVPFAGASTSAEQNSVSFVSASKTFNVPGLNTAVFFSKNPELFAAMVKENEANKGYRENIFGTLATCVCFDKCEYYADELCDYLNKNRLYATQQLHRYTDIRIVEPEGTYLIWLDCRKMGLSQKELVDRFTNVAKVGLEDGTDFGPEGAGFMRMNIAVPKATLEEAIRRIIDAMNANIN